MERENGKIRLEKTAVEKLLKEEHDKTKKMHEVMKINQDLIQERDLLMK